MRLSFLTSQGIRPFAARPFDANGILLVDDLTKGREPDSYPTEADLVAGLRACDPPAYEETVRRYGGRLLQTARRLLGCEEDARDCVQEAFAKAFSSVMGFEQRASLGTWLYRIAVNQCLMKLRQRRRGPEVSLDQLMPEFNETGCRFEPLWQFDHSVEELLARDHVRRTVREAIESLPDTARNVLLLRDIEELSTDEAAAILDISPGAVKVRLHRARAALKKLLEPVLDDGEEPAGD